MFKSASPAVTGCPAFVFNIGVVNAPKPGVRVVEKELECGGIKVEVEGHQKIQKTVQVERNQKAPVEKMPGIPYTIVTQEMKIQKTAPQKKRKQKNWYLQQVLREHALRASKQGPVQHIYRNGIHIDKFRSTGEPIPEIKVLSSEELYHKTSLLNEWQQKIKGIMKFICHFF